MPQYLVAIHHPDNYDPSAEGEEMVRDIDVLNEEDGVIQVSGEDGDFPYGELNRALSDPRWPGGNHRRAWRELRSAAWPSHLWSIN